MASFAIRNTFGSPGVRKKIACRHSDETRVGWCEVTVRTARSDGHHSNLFDTARKSMILSPKVAGIFFPESADTRFHRMFDCNVYQPNTVTLSESIPMRSIFTRTILCGLDSNSEDPDGKTSRTHGAFYHPLHATLISDRMK